MKRNIIVILLFFMACTTHAQHLMQVSEEKAADAATNFLVTFDSIYAGNNKPIVHRICPYKMDKYNALYEVVFTDSIEVIVAGSHSSRPILAVIPAPNLTPISINPDEFPLGLVAMFQRMIHEQRVIFDSLTTFDTTWNTYLNNDIIYSGNHKIGPLLKTKWNQDYVKKCGCREYYNKYMPTSNGHCTCGDDTTKYPSGCTVTAFGQVMNYWKYPVLVNNSDEQFDWCNMPNQLYCTDTAGKRLEAVSRLMKILGDDFDVSYGSISYVIDLAIDDRCFGFLSPRDALDVAINKYNYNRDAYVRHHTWVTDDEWERKIRRELELGRPVIFYAFDGFWTEGAHTFVCDGYDRDNDLYHFNWGHGDAGGWCSLWEIVEDDNSWDYDEGAVFDFYPSTPDDVCDYSLELDLYYYLFYWSHMQENVPVNMLFPQPYTITPQTMATLVSAHSSTRSDFRTIPSGDTAVYRAHQEIILQDGFEAEWGSDFTAEIVPCPACDTHFLPIHPIFDSLFPPRQTSTDSLSGTADAAYSHLEDYDLTRAEIYPNPTTGELTVGTDGEAEAIVVYNAKGSPVGGWNIEWMTGEWLSLDVSTLHPGAYILTVRTHGGTRVARFVKQ